MGAPEFGLAASACLFLIACSDQGGPISGEPWYRAEGSSGSYLITRADQHANSCLVLGVETPNGEPIPAELTDVAVVGGDAQIGFASLKASADLCEPFFLGDWTSVDHASGTISLRDFVTTPEGASEACTIDLDLVVDEMVIEQVGVQVWSPSCPRPDGDAEVVTQISAAYSQRHLVVAGWEPNRKVCAWVQFRVEESAYEGTDVELPPHWSPYGTPSYWGYVEQIDQGDCDPTTLEPYDMQSGTWEQTDDMEGMLVFRESEVGTADTYEFPIPCTLDIDMTMWMTEFWYFVPNRILLAGSKIPVAGACQ